MSFFAFKRKLYRKGGKFSLNPKKKGAAKNMLQEIKTLVQTLNEQRDAYYNRNSSTMLLMLKLDGLTVKLVYEEGQDD